MTQSAEHRQSITRFAAGLGALAILLSLLPILLAIQSAAPGSAYLGYVFNTDDHMVYSAWMLQAQQGRFFFENLFSIDPQSGQSVHLYFWLMGLVSKATGLFGAALLGRILFSAVFVWLVTKLVLRFELTPFLAKLALALILFGGGLGFLVWETFGRAFTTPIGQSLAPLFGGTLPNDVWQPELAVWPSMLTNGLFMASLCLMLWIVLAVLESEHSWRPVPGGALAFLLLMNIHSYDVLTLGLVLVVFLACLVRNGLFSWAWFGRVMAMAAGILPAAFWFLHILQTDPVFQARAATPTYMTNFRALLGSIFVLAVLALMGMYRSDGEQKRRWRWAMAGAFLLVAWALGSSDGNSYWLTPATWIVFFVGAGALAVYFSSEDRLWNFMLAWAWAGLAAPYFPALFQRKLAAGLLIPWAYLAAVGLHYRLATMERQARNLVAVVGIGLACATSVLWLQRELLLIRDDVSTTTVQPAYLTRDTQVLLDKVRSEVARNPRVIVYALPGVPQPTSETPVGFGRPVATDLNPIVTGLTGARTYAGHWSETVDYGRRRNRLMSMLLGREPFSWETGVEGQIADLLIVPKLPEPLNEELIPVNDLGEILHAGPQWILIRRRGS